MADGVKWISAGALGGAFEREPHHLPAIDDLQRRRLQLHFENGALIEYRFTSETHLERTVRDPGQAGYWPVAGRVAYSAMEIRPGIFLVSIVEPGLVASVLALLLDLPMRICTMMLAQFPDRRASREPLIGRLGAGQQHLTGVAVTFLSGAIDAPYIPNSRRHEPTRDLVGRRVEYAHGGNERYEHFYLNDRFYTWHCVAGADRGLADTDRCHYFKVAPDLFLFVWCEKIVPALGFVVLDYRQMRSSGRVVGYENIECRTLTSCAVGARMRIVGGR
jgi:hypothetical protein